MLPVSSEERMGMRCTLVADADADADTDGDADTDADADVRNACALSNGF